MTFRRPYAIDATRLQETRRWVVSVSNSGPFGPRRGRRRGDGVAAMASRATPSPRPPESLRASREHSSRAHRAEGSCHITQVVLIRTGLSSNQRTTVGALAVIDVHARDVMKAMADAGVSESTDFDWQC